MRLGLLTTSFPRFEGDSAGCFVLGFARALAARGHEISVLAPAPSEPLNRPSWPGVTLQWVRYAWPRSWQRTFYGAGAPDNLARDPRALLGAPPAVGALAAALLRQRPRWDALVTHWALPCGLLGASLRGRLRHLAVIHSADLHLLERLPARAALARRLVRGSDRLLFVNAEQKRRFCALLPGELRADGEQRGAVEPMGIDLPYPGAVVQPRSPRRRFVLLTLARLVPVKGLCEALRVLRDRGDLAWWIAGEGPERERLGELARGAALEVRLLGHVAGARKQALLRDADAFLLPSRILPSGRSEGMPTAVLEAMAHGLPIVASNVGGLPELLSHSQDALLFDPAQATALREAIDRIQRDASLRARLGSAARQRARRHAWPAVAERVEPLLMADN